MSNKPLFLDFSNVKLPNIDAWGLVTLPIRLLGRAAIESSPDAQTYRLATEDIASRTKSDSRH
jgi:hypothetical protein